MLRGSEGWLLAGRQDRKLLTGTISERTAMNDTMMMRTLTLALLLGLAAPVLAQPTNQLPDEKISDIDKVGNTAENIATKPLKDLNLMKDKIPPEVLAVMKEPYSLKGIKGCSQFKARITRLTELLGPDVDSGLAAKRGQNAGEFALSAAESVAGSLIPGAGLIRKISGAEAAQKKAQAAVLAGQLRRAYLKGTARAKGCKV